MSEVTFEQVLSQVKALPPEDAAKLRDYLNAQIQQDETVEAARELAHATSKRDLSEEYRWIEEHREEYAGQWVALKGSHLVSSGKNGVEVIQAARDAGFPDAFIKLVLPAEQIQYTVF
ncbi:MAG TPA: DUF5678 domain-containing protein [Blastocatellia bacterium]|nr:DUF5678 domain-containing protein [Blastocatellia bacterium]